MPRTFVSTNASRAWVATCGLCSVAAWKTVSAPWMQRATQARSAIDPTSSVNGPATMSSPTASRPASRSVRISASPRCPELPVTRTVMLAPTLYVEGISKPCEGKSKSLGRKIQIAGKENQSWGKRFQAFFSSANRDYSRACARILRDCQPQSPRARPSASRLPQGSSARPRFVITRPVNHCPPRFRPARAPFGELRAIIAQISKIRNKNLAIPCACWP